MAERRLRTAASVAGTVAAVYFSARLVTTVFFWIAAELSGTHSRFGPDATISSLAMGWDAQWYWVIADQGYPSQLPVDDTGRVTQNAWAFLPLFPWTARALGTVLGGYPTGAIVLAAVAGYAASVVFFLLLRDRLGDTAALWAVVFFANGPLAAMFQMGYAESLGLLWLFLALWALLRRRFVWMYPLVVLLGFTRPGVLAFALLLGLYGIHRWIRRRDDPLPGSHIAHIIALGALATIVGFAWQVIAGLATGDPSAYLETELAWRRDWVGSEEQFVPFAGFVTAARVWFGIWGLPPIWGPIALVILVVGAAAVLIRSSQVRRLGPEIRLWGASYLVYLLAVFFPQSSTFRLLLPLSPVAAAVAVPRSRWWRIGVLVICLAGQWVWIHEMLALGDTFYRIP
ncbi:membrane protein [Microbacterium oleivorans]|uniref:Putative integral membrane protein n=1 Tax=Microbacterium oleivorans TaxID=273677 RepID=A0A031FS61_9MICO|nr:membrane protein [Microbacterium oleivorans]EZP27031.1 putative integral membrane protein [Microbacterium oleivorans]